MTNIEDVENKIIIPKNPKVKKSNRLIDYFLFLQTCILEHTNR